MHIIGFWIYGNMVRFRIPALAWGWSAPSPGFAAYLISESQFLFREPYTGFILDTSPPVSPLHSMEKGDRGKLINSHIMKNVRIRN
jgi:hypothetical protein